MPSSAAKYILCVVALMLSEILFAQYQSGKAYQFLDLPTTSRSLSVGGNVPVLGDDQAGFAFQNPAILRDSTRMSVALNTSPMLGKIFYGSAIYVHKDPLFKGNVAVGVQYINYGEMEWTDEDANILGTFHASEAALYLIYSRALTPRINMAATIKPIFSSFENSNSFGLAMDLGVIYRAANNRFRAGAVLRNVGGQIKSYDDDVTSKSINTDLSIGLCHKAEHAPFRFYLALKDICHWDLSTTGNDLNWGDNLMRHLLIGAEFLPIRNFYISAGYNQRMRRESRDSDVGGAAGISWGFGLRVAKIDISYGMQKYHISGAHNSITFSTNLNRFL